MNDECNKYNPPFFVGQQHESKGSIFLSSYEGTLTHPGTVCAWPAAAVKLGGLSADTHNMCTIPIHSFML